MTWVERLDAQDAGMPELWNLVCIQVEQVAESFGKTLYARNNRLIVAAKRIKNCVHVVRAPSDGSQPEESIDVCLDEKGRRGRRRIPEVSAAFHDTYNSVKLVFLDAG